MRAEESQRYPILFPAAAALRFYAFELRTLFSGLMDRSDERWDSYRSLNQEERGREREREALELACII